MFDHFDTQISPEETQYYRDWLAWGEYMETINKLDDESKAEMDEIDMRCEQAAAELDDDGTHTLFVAAIMEKLDSGAVKFN
tara:strand:- start:617 stop:859 length:243 start_codon:yes stop_codon:yes gene_type:complete